MNEEYERKRREEVHKILGGLERGTIISIVTDRSNGQVPNMARFDGPDSEGEPIIYFNGGARLDIGAIGGYKSIISIQEECPDGACVNCT
jgi:hypothetical protein